MSTGASAEVHVGASPATASPGAPAPRPAPAPKIGAITLAAPAGVAPMAGMTDTAFRRLVKRQGGCGLVVTEMVSSEGLVRGIDRTLEAIEGSGGMVTGRGRHLQDHMLRVAGGLEHSNDPSTRCRVASIQAMPTIFDFFD